MRLDKVEDMYVSALVKVVDLEVSLIIRAICRKNMDLYSIKGFLMHIFAAQFRDELLYVLL